MKKNIVKAGILTLFLDNRMFQAPIDIDKYQEINNKFLAFVYHLFADFAYQFGKLSMTSIFIFIGILFSLSYIEKLSIDKINWYQKLLSFLLAILMVISYSFTLKIEPGETSNIEMLFTDSVQVLKTLLTIIAWYFLYNSLQVLLEASAEKWASSTYKSILPSSRFDLVMKNLFSNYAFIVGSICLMWLPFILIDYPGVLIYDGVTQIMQYNGFEPLRTDHPILSTIVINLFFELGIKLSHPKWGLFLYVLFQTISLASAMAYTLLRVNQILNNKRVSYVLLIGVGILPIFPSFVTLITKDIFFAVGFVLFNTLIFEVLYLEKKSKNSLLITGLFLSSCLSLLFRKNILYVYVLVILIGIIAILIGKRRKQWAIFISILVLSIVSFNLIDSSLAKLYSANTDGLRRESFSVPFQQTARYAKYHGDEVTEEEKETIDKVLKYEGIETRYQPHLSNNVKYYHNEEATSAEMKEYFKVWFQQFMKHPITYFEATLEQNNSLFTMSKKNIYFNHLSAGYREKVPERNAIYEEYQLKATPLSLSLQNIKLKYYQLVDRLPIIGLLDNPSFYVILLLMIMMIGFKYKFAINLLTMNTFIMLLSLLAGPIVDGYTRYTALFIFIAPLLIGALIAEFQKIESDKMKKEVEL